MTDPLRRKWYSVAEASRELGEKPNTLHKRIRRGEIEAIDLNEGSGKRPRYRIPARELQRLLQEKRR